jgi:hypothetical protein
MTEYIRSKGLLPIDESDGIIQNTPGEIISYQEAYQRGASVEPFGMFIRNQLIQIKETGVPNMNGAGHAAFTAAR